MIWMNVSEKELDQMIENEKTSHRKSLEKLLKKAEIKANYKIHHLKGEPDDKIPLFIEKNKIDLLIMGTVARTGISGFIIGNTAEGLLQNISCSMFALKPQGFISPIKVYD